MTLLAAAGGVLSDTFGGILDAHPKDAERLARNLAAYGKAIVGDDNALAFLKYMSGRFGSGTIAPDPLFSPKGGLASGWATAKAKDDAFKKYNAALTKRQDLAGTLAGAAGTVATGSQGATAGTVAGTLARAVPWWVWVALALGVWFFFFR